MVKTQFLLIGVCKGSESHNTLLHMPQEEKKTTLEFTVLEALLLRKDRLILYLPDL